MQINHHTIAGQGWVRAGDVADEDPGAAELLVAAHQRQQDRHRAPLRPPAQGHVAKGRQGNGRQVCEWSCQQYTQYFYNKTLSN